MSYRELITLYIWYQIGTIRIWLSTYDSLQKTTACCPTLPRKAELQSNKLSYGSFIKSGIEKPPGDSLMANSTASFPIAQNSWIDLKTHDRPTFSLPC